jgi:diguanylate cyclase
MALALAAVAVIAAAGRVAVLHRRLRQLARLTIVDPLTGAFNRRHLDASLAAAIERRRRSGEPASLLLFDIDRFKSINDRLGHAAGDQALRAIVTLAAHRLRRIDALFRIGGDEFAILLPNAHSASAIPVAEDLRALVMSTTLASTAPLSISIGVGELADGQTAADWIRRVDVALYRAKRLGRNGLATAGHERGARRRPPLPTVGGAAPRRYPRLAYPVVTANTDRQRDAGDRDASSDTLNTRETRR